MKTGWVEFKKTVFDRESHSELGETNLSNRRGVALPSPADFALLVHGRLEQTAADGKCCSCLSVVNNVLVFFIFANEEKNWKPDRFGASVSYNRSVGELYFEGKKTTTTSKEKLKVAFAAPPAERAFGFTLKL